MNSVRVDKHDLIRKVKINRDAHRQKSAEAYEGYRKEAIARMEIVLLSAKAGQPFNLNDVIIVKPQDYTSSYDAVLGMLEMSKDADVVLEHQDYMRYVQDEWEWKHSWTASTGAYGKK